MAPLDRSDRQREPQNENSLVPSPRIRISPIYLSTDRRLGDDPLVTDVVLGDRGCQDRGTLFVAGTAAAERLDRGYRFPSFEDVDSARVEQVCRQREVEAARCPARLPHYLDASRQVVVALLRVDHDVSSDNDHGSPSSVRSNYHLI